jgi:hypothetical protein
LKKDGSVVAVANNEHEQNDVSDWKNIVDIYLLENRTFGLTEDGTVVFTTLTD